jgi:hypothetical protein
MTRPGAGRVSRDREHVEQAHVVSWFRRTYPDLLMYHVPNEGRRSLREGARQKSMGLERGIPDLCVLKAASGYHGLYIEMKDPREGRPPPPEQRAILDYINGQGYLAVVCFGRACAREVIGAYLGDSRGAVLGMLEREPKYGLYVFKDKEERP